MSFSWAGAAQGSAAALRQAQLDEIAKQKAASDLQDALAERAYKQAVIQFQQAQNDRLARKDTFDQQQAAAHSAAIDAAASQAPSPYIGTLIRGGLLTGTALLPPEAKQQEPYTLSPGQVRYDPSGKVLSQNEKAATNDAFTLAPGAIRFDSQGHVLAKGAAPISVARPDYEWVTRNGVPMEIVKGTARPGDVQGGNARAIEPNGQNRQALSFYNRAKTAVETIDQGNMEDQIAHMGTLGQAYLNSAPNFMQSQLGQSYRQAQRAFTEARLRKESGAAINKDEYLKDAMTYFAQPGDSAATIAQKRALRQQVLDGMAFASGPAYREFYGEDFQRSNGGGGAEHWVRDPKTGKLVRQ